MTLVDVWNVIANVNGEDPKQAVCKLRTLIGCPLFLSFRHQQAPTYSAALLKLISVSYVTKQSWFLPHYS